MGHPNIEDPSSRWDLNPRDLVSKTSQINRTPVLLDNEFLRFAGKHRYYEILTFCRCVVTSRIELESHPSQG